MNDYPSVDVVEMLDALDTITLAVLDGNRHDAVIAISAVRVDLLRAARSAATEAAKRLAAVDVDPAPDEPPAKEIDMRERDGVKPALTYACPTCDAAPRQRCFAIKNNAGGSKKKVGDELKTPHKSRRDLARLRAKGGES